MEYRMIPNNTTDYGNNWSSEQFYKCFMSFIKFSKKLG